MSIYHYSSVKLSLDIVVNYCFKEELNPFSLIVKYNNIERMRIEGKTLKALSQSLNSEISKIENIGLGKINAKIVSIFNMRFISDIDSIESINIVEAKPIMR
jgi:RNA recognition motif-containing protein